MTHHPTTVIRPSHLETQMYPHQELDRIHRKELLAEAERQRTARSLSAGRRWRALARFATKKAEAAERR